MENFLLSYNETKHKELLTRADAAIKLVQPFVEQIREVCGFDITPDLFSDLIYSNDAAKIAEAIRERITIQLKTAGISSPGIRDAAIKTDLEAFYRLFNTFAKHRNNNHEGFAGLEINEGEVRIKPDWEAETKERFCTYLQTEKGKELREHHLAFADAFNRFCALLPKYKQDVFNSLYHGVLSSVISKNGNGEIVASTIDYDYFIAMSNSYTVEDFNARQAEINKHE